MNSTLCKDSGLTPRGYTRGRDLSGSMEGAGGIGGLLARTDMPSLINSQPSTACYHADGNGNVTCLINTNQIIVAKYLYDPYGNTLSASGPLAEANLYRFSSKEQHPNSGLVYYLYRFYVSGLQRWLNRDPWLETGGYNLLQFAVNDPINTRDTDGLMAHRKKRPSCYNKHTKAMGRPVGGARGGKAKPNFKRAPGKGGARCGGIGAAVWLSLEEINDELPYEEMCHPEDECPSSIQKKVQHCFLFWCYYTCDPPLA